MVMAGICFPAMICAQPAQDNNVAPVKMNYLNSNSLEEALHQSYARKKPLFVNCYAKWARPCQGMDMMVFNNEDFCKYMDKNFVNLFMDMASPEGKKFAETYGVYTFAQYLVLDYKGNVIHRIQGGARLPEFKENVDMALHKDRSLAGTTAKYKSGKYSKKDLNNYLKATMLAGEDSTFRKVGKEYMAMLDDSELSRPENWLLSRLNRTRDGRFYKSVIANKPAFVKSNGEKKVNSYIESTFSNQFLSYATGEADYDADALERLHNELKLGSLPDTTACEILYNVAFLRGNRRYGEMIKYLEENTRYLDHNYGVQNMIDLSMVLPGINDADKQAAVSYLKSRAEKQRGQNAQRIREVAERLTAEAGKGIEFDHSPFAELQKKAQAEGKLIFIDCYTSWCGPCKMLAKNVFPRKDVGDYFNSHFINTKIDMEKGEGVDLAKKYEIKAFPTLLLVDAEGKVVSRQVGALSAEKLLEWVKSVK